MVKIRFLGATQMVTGSRFLVESDKARFLIDCGMFQGIRDEASNSLPFDFDPRSIDFVVLTHAHIDHIGLIPKLVRKGYQGRILATNSTSQIAYHLLLDAAKIQEGNQRRGEELLYDTNDALFALDMLESQDYDKEVNVNGVKITFEKVGHVLGASSVRVEVEGRILYFSGDVGRAEHPFMEGFDSKERAADYVLTESLYGGRMHEERSIIVNKLIEQINNTLERDGNVIIPAFALQRTQEMLNILKNAYRENRIKKKVDVFVDSPLATKITGVYSHAIFKNGVIGKELFDFDKVRYVNYSKNMIKKSKEQKIILAGSGMCDGGRIMGHLLTYLPDSRNSILIVGFQAEGTLGRTLISNPRPQEVEIMGKNVKVRAEICEYYGLSAHGDQKDLDAWLSRFNKDRLKKIFLIHSEIEGYEGMQKYSSLKDKMYVPKLGEEVRLI